MGRAKLKKGKKRDVNVSIRLTPPEADRLRAYADARGWSLSQACRMSVRQVIDDAQPKAAG